jgi:hypothetical protein
MKAYREGELVQLRPPDYKDATGSLVDPTTLVFKAKRTSATRLDEYWVYGQHSSFVRESLGKYRLDLRPDAPGFWEWQVVATGPGANSYGSAFYVGESL